MKKITIKYYFLIVLLALQVTACQDQLELQPSQSVSEDLALNSDKNVKAVLIGAYDELGVDDVFGGGVLRSSELLGGDGELRWVGTFNAPREIFNKGITTGNGDVAEVWLESYETINITNNVLSALDIVNEDDRATVEGEALFIRSLLYFELVRFYAKPYEAGQANTQPGVPLVFMPTRDISDENKVARNTVEEVYNQIIGDLIKAEGELPEDNEWRASSGAAAALLARIYLQKGDYAAARDAANRVIESGNYSLLANYKDVFGRDENSSEDIFAIQVTTQDGINDMTTYFSIQDFGGRDGDIEILPGHLALYNTPDLMTNSRIIIPTTDTKVYRIDGELFESGDTIPAGSTYEIVDQRELLFFEANGGVTYSGKWNNQFGNISLIRLAEMYLIRAEANFRLGTTVGATPLADYNKVHTRAGLPAATSITLAEILLERRRELAQEGFKIHDIKRLKQNVGNLPYDANKLVFPIPSREIEANPNLTQNAGY